MTKEIIETKTTTPALVGGAADTMSTSEVMIPRILLVQKTTGLVETHNAKFGEFRENIEGQQVKPDVIIFGYFATWLIRSGAKFIRVEPVTAENAGLPWDFEEDGEKMKRVYTYNYYCLLAGEDPEIAFPYLVSMASTSANTAKRINTVMMKMKRAGVPSWSKIFCLSSAREESDNGPYWTFGFSMGDESTSRQKAAAEEWAQIIAEGARKVVVVVEDEVTF